MHWNGDISSSELATIIRLVVKKKYSIDDAIEAVLNDEYCDLTSRIQKCAKRRIKTVECVKCVKNYGI